MHNISNFIREHAAVGIAQRCNISTRLHRNANNFKCICTIGAVSIEEVFCIKENALAVANLDV